MILSAFIHAVTLKIADDASIGSQFCPGSIAEFECTTEGSLLWEIVNTGANHIFDDPAQPSRTLGIFRLHLNGISQMNGTASVVNSTAVVSNVQLSYNGTVLRCLEYADLSMFRETVLKVAGEELAQLKLLKLSSLFSQLYHSMDCVTQRIII